MRAMKSGAAIGILLICTGCASVDNSAAPATTADSAQPSGPKRSGDVGPLPPHHHGGCMLPPEPIPDAPSGSAS